MKSVINLSPDRRVYCGEVYEVRRKAQEAWREAESAMARNWLFRSLALRHAIKNTVRPIFFNAHHRFLSLPSKPSLFATAIASSQLSLLPSFHHSRSLSSAAGLSLSLSHTHTHSTLLDFYEKRKESRYFTCCAVYIVHLCVNLYSWIRFLLVLFPLDENDLIYI